MKSKLTYVALLSIAGLATAAVVESTGIATASGLAYALPFGAFITSLVFMTFTMDYGRNVRPLTIPADREIMLPANEAFTAEEVADNRPVAGRRRVARRRRIAAA